MRGIPSSFCRVRDRESVDDRAFAVHCLTYVTFTFFPNEKPLSSLSEGRLLIASFYGQLQFWFSCLVWLDLLREPSILSLYSPGRCYVSRAYELVRR